MAAKYPTFEAMTEAAGADYKQKATSQRVAEGLEPYAPAGMVVNPALLSSYDRSVGRVAGDFRNEWGEPWRRKVFTRR